MNSDFQLQLWDILQPQIALLDQVLEPEKFIRVYAPPQIDDVPFVRRFTWDAMANKQRVGGVLVLHQYDADKIAQPKVAARTLLRSMAFGISAAYRPDSHYLKIACQLYDVKHPHRPFLLAYLRYAWRHFWGIP